MDKTERVPTNHVDIGQAVSETNDADIDIKPVVEIDESMFGKKQKYMKGKKYKRYWLFGMAERIQKEMSFFYCGWASS